MTNCDLLVQHTKKSFNAIYHSNRMKGKIHKVISINKENAYTSLIPAYSVLGSLLHGLPHFMSARQILSPFCTLGWRAYEQKNLT